MPTQSPVASAACNVCGKKYKWKESLAGKSVKCPCGGQVAFAASPVSPKAPPAPTVAAPIKAKIVAARPTPPARPAPPKNVLDEEPSDPYELSQPTPPAAPAPRANVCPGCSAMMNPGAVLCTRCGYNTRTGKSLSTKIKTGPDLADVASAAGMFAGRTLASLILGGVAAIGAGLGWGFIAVGTQREIGYAAWGVGLLTGGAMRLVNHAGGILSGFAGALFAVAGLGIGKYIIFSNGFEPFSPHDILWFALAIITAFQVASGYTGKSDS